MNEVQYTSHRGRIDKLEDRLISLHVRRACSHSPVRRKTYIVQYSSSSRFNMKISRLSSVPRECTAVSWNSTSLRPRTLSACTSF